MSAESTKKSLAESATQRLPSTRASVRVAVSRCLTPTEIESSSLSVEEKLICLTALVHSLQRIVMSPDQWWLAHNSAKHVLSDAGMISEEKYAEFKRLLEEERAAQAACNPMSSMF